MNAPWLPQAPGATTPLEGVLGWNPALLEKFKRFHGLLWEDRLLEPELLEILRVRIAYLHGCAAELAIEHADSGLSPEKRAAVADWERSDAFSPKERALLSYADQIPFQHNFIGEDLAAEVRTHLDDRGFVAFSLAIAMFDALCRLRMTFGLEPAAAQVNPPGPQRELA